MADTALTIVKSEPLPDLSIMKSEPAEPPSALSRFGSAFLDQINPVNAIKGIYQQVAHPLDTANARLRYESEHPLETGLTQSPLGQYGGAHAGLRIGAGDVAGGAGEGAGLIANAATPAVVPAVVGGVTRAGTAAAKIAPDIAATLVKHGSTATGAALGGPAGAIVGAGVGEELAARLRAGSWSGSGPSAAGYDRYMPNTSPTAPPGPVSPTTAPTTPWTASSISPQQLRNEIGVFAARSKISLSDAENALAESLVREQGQTPQQAVARIAQAQHGEAPAPNPELAARMQTLRNTPSAGGATHYPGEGTPGENLHDVAAGTVKPVAMPWEASAQDLGDRLRQTPGQPGVNPAVAAARAEWHPSADVTSGPVLVKPTLTAAETQEFLRLKALKYPDAAAYANVLAARKLGAMSGSLSDVEMRADMAARAAAGQKSLMARYGGGLPQ